MTSFLAVGCALACLLPGVATATTTATSTSSAGITYTVTTGDLPSDEMSLGIAAFGTRAVDGGSPITATSDGIAATLAGYGGLNETQTGSSMPGSVVIGLGNYKSGTLTMNFSSELTSFEGTMTALESRYLGYVVNAYEGSTLVGGYSSNPDGGTYAATQSATATRFSLSASGGTTFDSIVITENNQASMALSSLSYTATTVSPAPMPAEATTPIGIAALAVGALVRRRNRGTP